MNQVWHASDGRLEWYNPHGQGNMCIDAGVPMPKAAFPRLTLRVCAMKRGQRFQRHDVQNDGSFFLYDADSSRCLGEGGGKLDLVDCDPRQRWRELRDRIQVQHVRTSRCLQENGAGVELHVCSRSGVQHKFQRFEISNSPNWIRRKVDWGDNGRRLDLEKCLDYAPEPNIELSVQDCALVTRSGISWELQGEE